MKAQPAKWWDPRTWMAFAYWELRTILKGYSGDDLSDWQATGVIIVVEYLGLGALTSAWSIYHERRLPDHYMFAIIYLTNPSDSGSVHFMKPPFSANEMDLLCRVMALEAVLSLLVRKVALEQNAQETTASELKQWIRASERGESRFQGFSAVEGDHYSAEIEAAFANLVSLISKSVLRN